MKIAIVVLHLDRREALLACLDSCAKLDHDDHEITVVENGTPPGPDWRAAAGARVRVLRSPVNVGYAAGNNLGIRDALGRGADAVLLLNDDTLVAPDVLARLAAAAEDDPAAGALGPVVLTADEPARVWFAGATLDRATCTLATPGVGGPPPDGESRPRRSAYVTGCCLLLTRTALERVGLLDERFFLYWEDTDWGARAAAAGFASLVVPAARIRHRVSLSTGGEDSALKAYHRVRSHLLFARLHAPAALPGLRRRLARDVAWLALRSRAAGRWRRARAHVAALRDHHLGRGGPGPAWLWTASR